MAELNYISCEVRRRKWDWLGHSGERVLMTASRHWDGHQKVEGREGDLRPLGERLLRKKGTWLYRRAGMQPRQRRATVSVGMRA